MNLYEINEVGEKGNKVKMRSAKGIKCNYIVISKIKYIFKMFLVN